MKTPNQLKGEFCERYVERKLNSEGCSTERNPKGGYDIKASCSDGIKFVEVKSKKSKLTPLEKRFRDAVKRTDFKYEVVKCDISQITGWDQKTVDTHFHNLSQQQE